MRTTTCANALPNFGLGVEMANHGDEEKTYKHESYGMLRITRGSGGPRRLFGSALAKHGTTITIALSRGERKHSLGQDWFSARETLFEVEMSPAQFAEFITTIGFGSGVPCTIRRTQDTVNVENPPESPTVHEEVLEYFDENLERYKRLSKEILEDTEELLTPGRKVSKEDLKKLKNKAYHANMIMDSTLQFVGKQFTRATNKIVNVAKAEVESFMSFAVEKAGMKALEHGFVDANALITEVSEDSKKADENG